MNKIFLALTAISLHAVLGACSSDDSSGGTRAEAIAACKKYCNKLVECAPEATVDCDSLCDSTVPSTVSSTNCDVSAMNAKVNECVAGTCEALDACAGELDALCPGEEQGAGGGGNGTGGSGTGTGGSSTGTDCSVCDDVLPCCQALAAETGGDPTADCEGFSAAECTASGQESLFVQSCNAMLQAGSGLGIAACQ